LASNERLDGKVKQITLLNLGHHFAVEAPLWPAVCQRVTELMAGQASLLDSALPKTAAQKAEWIVAQLLAKRAVVCPPIRSRNGHTH